MTKHSSNNAEIVLINDLINELIFVSQKGNVLKHVQVENHDLNGLLYPTKLQILHF